MLRLSGVHRIATTPLAGTPGGVTRRDDVHAGRSHTTNPPGPFVEFTNASERPSGDTSGLRESTSLICLSVPPLSGTLHNVTGPVRDALANTTSRSRGMMTGQN